jgi:hypothetical protein
VRRLRIIGLCLAAVFAIAAVTASSASAKKPEWGKCVAQAGGKYLDGNCQTKGKGGSFEWKKGATLPNVPFTGHNEGSGGVLYTGLNICEGNGKAYRIPKAKCEAEGYEWTESGEGEFLTVECLAETNTGEASGKNKILNVHVKFTGCTAFGGALPCQNKGAAVGEINTQALKGELGYVEEGKAVGVRLEPNVKKGAFAEFECAEFLGTVVAVGNNKEGVAFPPKGGADQVISPITPVNEMTNKYTQVFTVDPKKVENVPTNFDGKKLSALEDELTNLETGEGSTWSRAGEEITNVNTPTEEGEIKA